MPLNSRSCFPSMVVAKFKQRIVDSVWNHNLASTCHSATLKSSLVTIVSWGLGSSLSNAGIVHCKQVS